MKNSWTRSVEDIVSPKVMLMGFVKGQRFKEIESSYPNFSIIYSI